MITERNFTSSRRTCNNMATE